MKAQFIGYIWNHTLDEQVCWYFGLIHVHFGVSIEWGDLQCTWFTCGSLIKQVNQYTLSLAQINTIYLHVITCTTYWTLRERERERERERDGGGPTQFSCSKQMKFENSLHCCRKHSRKKERKEEREIIQRKTKNEHTRGEQETAVFLSVANNISRHPLTGNVDGSGEIS